MRLRAANGTNLKCSQMLEHFPSVDSVFAFIGDVVEPEIRFPKAICTDPKYPTKFLVLRLSQVEASVITIVQDLF